MATTLVYFPFNALLLTFGTEVTAAYHIGNRLYHQIAGPLYRSYNTVASIVVGQSLGGGSRESARSDVRALSALALLTLALPGVVLTIGTDPLVGLFTTDQETVRYTVGFARAFGIAIPFIGVFFVLSGVLRGAGDTRTPFIARVTGWAGFFLGFSYFASVTLGFGIAGIYAGITLAYVWMALLLVARYRTDAWLVRASSMLADRHHR